MSDYDTTQSFGYDSHLAAEACLVGSGNRNLIMHLHQKLRAQGGPLHTRLIMLFPSASVYWILVTIELGPMHTTTI